MLALRLKRAGKPVVQLTLQSQHEYVQHVIEVIKIGHICEAIVEVSQSHEFIKELRNCRQQLADALCFSHITQKESIS